MPFQRCHKRADVALAVAEDHGVLHVFAAKQPAKRLALTLRRGPCQVLCHRVGRGSGRRHLDHLRVRNEFVAELLDVVRQRCREEQCLAERRQQADNALDVGNEAHVEHPVGLVDDEDLHIRQQDLATFEMIEKAARGGDQNIDPFVERRVLVGKAHAADQQRHRQLVIGAEFFEGVGNLCRKFACRCQDQRPGKPRLGASGSKDLDHRQREGGGLAGPCLRRSEDVASHQYVGYRFFLDRGRGGVA